MAVESIEDAVGALNDSVDRATAGKKAEEHAIERERNGLEKERLRVGAVAADAEDAEDALSFAPPRKHNNLTGPAARSERRAAPREHCMAYEEAAR